MTHPVGCDCIECLKAGRLRLLGAKGNGAAPRAPKGVIVGPDGRPADPHALVQLSAVQLVSMMAQAPHDYGVELEWLKETREVAEEAEPGSVGPGEDLTIEAVALVASWAEQAEVLFEQIKALKEYPKE